MPKLAKELSALEVKRLVHPGRGLNCVFPVGGVSGLMLQVTPGGSRSWILRTRVGERRREIGLGPYPEVSLAVARERAREAKDQIRSGMDPVAERKAARAALVAVQRRGLTFAKATERFLDTRLEGFRNEKHKAQWRNTLEAYALPTLGPMLVEEIGVQDILRVLEPIWKSKNETASRLRGRIEAVLSWATVAGHRSGDNPARWAGNLKQLLPAASKSARTNHHPALTLGDAPRWFGALRERDGIGSRALEFLALTAARSKEVRGATWHEIDLVEGMWTIPAARMKAEREHRVPLVPQALDILSALPRFAGIPLVFPAVRGGMLSDMTLSATMKRIHETDIRMGGSGFVDRISGRPAVPHGLRSTFRDWVAERTEYPGELAEAALAHRIPNAVEAAYRRSDMIEKRRRMMKAWARLLYGNPEPNSTIKRMR